MTIKDDEGGLIHAMYENVVVLGTNRPGYRRSQDLVTHRAKQHVQEGQ
jgi:hypothetical protein